MTGKLSDCVAEEDVTSTGTSGNVRATSISKHYLRQMLRSRTHEELCRKMQDLSSLERGNRADHVHNLAIVSGYFAIMCT